MRRVLCSSARRFGVRGLPRRTRVHEVAPRDGLQNETTVLSTPAKLSLIRQLVASGPSSVEVTSFVRADVIPALADADEVCAQLWQQEWAHDARSDGMEFVGLVLNKHGFDRFLRAQLDAVTLVVSCTDTHSKANSGKGFDDALVSMFDLVRAHAEKSRCARTPRWPWLPLRGRCRGGARARCDGDGRGRRRCRARGHDRQRPPGGARSRRAGARDRSG